MILPRLILQVSVTFLAFTVSTGSLAQIYKCQDNGKTVFRDKPCADGKGEKFNLGATIENKDPTGILGDISGFWSKNGQTIKIRDALGILDRANSLMLLYLIPDRFTAEEVQHFQDTGDDSILRQKPVGKYNGFSAYPFIKLHLQFAKNLPRKKESIASAELEFFGAEESEPQLVRLDAGEAKESFRYISIFEDFSYGDINLESDGDDANASWKISIKAPLYYH